MRPKVRKRLILLSPLILLAFVGFIALGGAIVMQLWNWLLPTLFGWRAVTFWQALGLLALCRILFGGVGLHGGSRRDSAIRRRVADRVADRMAERWDQMTPEERERLRQRMRERWGVEPPPRESHGE
jgi:hypothetical protein